MRNIDSSAWAETAAAMTMGSRSASATPDRFLSTAAKPMIAGTKLWPTPAAWARNSFHQS